MLAAFVPSDVVDKQGLTRISLVTPRTISHQEIIPNVFDDRQKGLAVTIIAAHPLSENTIPPL